MSTPDYFAEFPADVEVCDCDGGLLYVNDRAEATVAGRAQLGMNILDCHPEPARTKLEEMLASGKANVYTIEKAGQRKLIYQAPWYEGDRFAGLVELSLEIPFEMPNFERS